MKKMALLQICWLPQPCVNAQNVHLILLHFTGRSFRRGKKSVPKRQLCKKTACSSFVPPWLVAVGG